MNHVGKFILGIISTSLFLLILWGFGKLNCMIQDGICISDGQIMIKGLLSIFVLSVAAVIIYYTGYVTSEGIWFIKDKFWKAAKPKDESCGEPYR